MWTVGVTVFRLRLFTNHSFGYQNRPWRLGATDARWSCSLHGLHTRNGQTTHADSDDICRSAVSHPFGPLYLEHHPGFCFSSSCTDWRRLRGQLWKTLLKVVHLKGTLYKHTIYKSTFGNQCFYLLIMARISKTGKTTAFSEYCIVVSSVERSSWSEKAGIKSCLHKWYITHFP